MLRVLQKAGLTKEDVKLVELPSTGDVYSNALAAKQVDVAPLGGVASQALPGQVRQGRRHARSSTGCATTPATCTRRPASLERPGQGGGDARVRAGLGAGQRWIDEHPEEWIEGYYVKDQGLTEEDGRVAGRARRHPDIPADWTEAIERQQETIDLLARRPATRCSRPRTCTTGGSSRAPPTRSRRHRGRAHLTAGDAPQPRGRTAAHPDGRRAPGRAYGRRRLGLGPADPVRRCASARSLLLVIWASARPPAGSTRGSCRRRGPWSPPPAT